MLLLLTKLQQTGGMRLLSITVQPALVLYLISACLNATVAWDVLLEILTPASDIPHERPGNYNKRSSWRDGGSWVFG